MCTNRPVSWRSMKVISERLAMRPFVASDEDDVHVYASDPAVCFFTDWGPNSPADTADFIARAVTDGAPANIAVTLVGDVLGAAGVGARGHRCRFAQRRSRAYRCGSRARLGGAPRPVGTRHRDRGRRCVDRLARRRAWRHGVHCALPPTEQGIVSGDGACGDDVRRAHPGRRCHQRRARGLRHISPGHSRLAPLPCATLGA